MKTRIKRILVTSLVASLLLSLGLIQHVKAYSNIWEAIWRQYQWAEDPEGVHQSIANISSSTVVYNEYGDQWVKIAQTL